MRKQKSRKIQKKNCKKKQEKKQKKKRWNLKWKMFTFFIFGVRFEYDMSKSKSIAASAIVSSGVFKQVSQRNSNPQRSGFSTI